jgi:hypothetical protein
VLDIRWGDDRKNTSCPSKLAISVVEAGEVRCYYIFMRGESLFLQRYMCNVELNLVGETVQENFTTYESDEKVNSSQ